MDEADQPIEEAPKASLGEMFLQMATSIGQWIKDHQEEIDAFILLNRIARAGEMTGLYAPVAPAWLAIRAAVEADEEPEAISGLILASYGPGGDSQDVLIAEILGASRLRGRLPEVEQVLDSWREGRNYVAICGTLPLVEGLLAAAHGKWKKRLEDYPLSDRLMGEDGGLTDAETAELLLNATAVQMVMDAVRETWKARRMQPGAIVVALNRHLALHGTSRGWDTRDNATRSLLLLAAAARVADPLLAPRKAASTPPSSPPAIAPRQA